MKYYLKIALIVFPLFFLAIAVVSYLEMERISEYYATKDFTPQQRQDFRVWYADPIGISSDQFTIIDFDEEFTSAAKSMMSSWDNVTDHYEQQETEIRNIYSQKNSTGNNNSIINDHQAFLNKFENLARHPDFSLQSASDFTHIEDDVVNYQKMFSAFLRLKIIEINLLIEKEEYQSAIDQMEYLALHYKPDINFSFMNALMSNIAAGDILKIIERNPEFMVSEYKDQIIRVLEFIHEEYHHESAITFSQRDTVSMIRLAILENKLDGWPENFEDMTLAEIHHLGSHLILMRLPISSYDPDELDQITSRVLFSISLPYRDESGIIEENTQQEEKLELQLKKYKEN